MFGGQRQSSASAKKRGVWTHTHSTPRQPRKSNAQGTEQILSLYLLYPNILFFDLRVCHCSKGWMSDFVCVLPAVVPEDGSVAFTVQSAHGEAALVQSALPAHCSLSFPSTLQGAVCL